jgi:hypothetical protein
MDRLAPALFVASLLFLSFVAGALVVLTETFPHRWLRDAHRATVALAAHSRGPGDLYRSEILWRVATREERGVTVHDPERAQEGYTIFTSGHRPSAFLVRMDGSIAHEWHMPYSRVWSDAAKVRRPLPDSHVYFRKAVAFPNGDLLAIYDGAGDTPHGYGLVKLDRDSNVVWSYLEHVHHDLAVAADGTIYALVHEIADHPIAGREGLAGPRIDDSIAILSESGEEQRRIRLLEALVSSPFGRLLGRLPCEAAGKGDLLHTNSIEIVDEETASRFPFLSSGQILLSMRELDLVAALDPDLETFTWGLRGPWIVQHDAELLDDGGLLLFDNAGDFAGHGVSRVLEIDPETMEIRWSYGGDEERPLQSWIRSAQQRLANGNTLITESNGGRLVEVTRDREVVWEYVSPVRAGPNDAYLPVLSWGTRLDPEFFDEELRRVLEHDPSPST